MKRQSYFSARPKLQSQQVPGSTVCKYGVSSSYGCGRVLDNYFDGINIRTDYFVDGGDSGGPNFFGNQAWGTTISELFINGVERGTIYAPVDHYGARLNVAILTQ